MSASSILKKATADDVSTIVRLLVQMQIELQEIPLDIKVVTESVRRSLSEKVDWFLFQDKYGHIFGTCHLQSVHNYWSLSRRYYLGGMYIEPSYRGQGHFRGIYQQLQNWATEHDGVQIYCHIHEDNEKSLAVFSRVDMTPQEYALCVNHWGK